MCKISHELVSGLKPLQGFNIGALGFGDLVLIFKVIGERNRSNLSVVRQYLFSP